MCTQLESGEPKMKVDSILALKASLVSVLLLAGSAGVVAQEGPDGLEEDLGFEGPVPEAVGSATYTVGYWHSSAGTNTGMAISIANTGSSNCSTTVRWYAGGGQLQGTTSLNVAGGQTLEHCSRNGLPQPVSCNVTAPAFVFIEGSADVFVSPSTCPIIVDAKQYYSSGVYRVATAKKKTKGD